MRRDPIVEEVRRHREAIAREHGNDVDAIVAAFQREDATSGVTTVSLPPKRFVKPATHRKLAKTRRPNPRMEPTRR
jgi:hypothetical protein